MMRSRVVLLIALLGSPACGAGSLADPVGAPAADPSALAAEIQPATVPDTPVRVNFGWRLDEAGSRVSGRGVVRVEAPSRARLDLFGPRGETYLMAALVDGEYRLPSATVAEIALPSPALLWSAFGVLQPPSQATLTSATTTDSTAELRYRTPAEETFAYTFRAEIAGSFRLQRLERAGRQGVIETVAIERDAEGAIARTRYRNWAEYRDLTLDVESIREEGPFPPNIWRPDVDSP